jgi:hypothetical protein
MEGIDGVVMECMWSDDVASMHEAWDDNGLPYPTLSHLVYTL